MAAMGAGRFSLHRAFGGRWRRIERRGRESGRSRRWRWRLGSTKAPPTPRQHAPAFEEALGRRQVDAAGGHQANLGERTAQCLEIGRTADVGRKDLDDVGTGLPGGEDLGGREGAGHDHLVVTPAEPDDFEVEGGGDDVLGAGQNRGPAVSGSSTVPAPRTTASPTSRRTWRITSTASGTVKVTSAAVTPPSARACTTLTRAALVSERTTATIPPSRSVATSARGSSRRYSTPGCVSRQALGL